MTDTPEATPANNAEVELATTSTETAEPAEADSPNREAAAYRRRLRDAEAERDALAERLADAQRQNVTSQVAQRFADPGDFWSTTQLSDVLGEDGGVDGEKLSAAMDAALEAKPHWRKLASVTESVSTVRSNDRVEDTSSQPTWADVLQGKLR